MSARILLLALPLALAACGESPRPISVVAPPPRAAPPAMGLDRVMGRDAPSLIALFGPPVMDAHEGPARKLQWRGPACTLDAYLYPPQQGGGPARVTWLDARTSTGADFDRASCIAALVRR